jgi:hypothetical protein
MLATFGTCSAVRRATVAIAAAREGADAILTMTGSLHTVD